MLENAHHRVNIMLTEKEAWAYLADKWANAKRYDAEYTTSTYMITVKSESTTPSIAEGCVGLCECVQDLHGLEKIDISTHENMNNVIQDYGKQHAVSGYYWSRFTEEGRDARAEFCRQQANKE